MYHTLVNFISSFEGWHYRSTKKSKSKRTFHQKGAAYLLRCLVCKITDKTLASKIISKCVSLPIYKKLYESYIVLRHISFQMKQKFKMTCLIHDLQVSKIIKFIPFHYNESRTFQHVKKKATYTGSYTITDWNSIRNYKHVNVCVFLVKQGGLWRTYDSGSVGSSRGSSAAGREGRKRGEGREGGRGGGREGGGNMQGKISWESHAPVTKSPNAQNNPSPATPKPQVASIKCCVCVCVCVCTEHEGSYLGIPGGSAGGTRAGLDGTRGTEPELASPA